MTQLPSIFKRRVLWGLGVAVAVFLSVSCQQTPPTQPVLSPPQLAQAQREDKITLKRITQHNTEMTRAFVSLQASGGWKKRGFFSAQESDQLEHLLFRFHSSYRQLIEMIDRHQHGASAKDVSVASKKMSQKLSTQAHQQLMSQSKFLVETFANDTIAIEKLNQRYPRSEISRSTYDQLTELLKSNGARQFAVLSRKVEQGWADSSYGLQMELVSQVGRFKNPAAHLIHFTEGQKKKVISLLEPGDILLTYTAGYASTIFIPGAFKHAIVYVGSVEDRRAIGLVPGRVSVSGGAAIRRQFKKNLGVEKTSEGRSANIIEAVFVGVKFSNLEYTMDTHMNRLVVLRPRLSAGDRRQYLAKVFSYLGQEYDFRFDFADASRQVCTETIYRALNGMNGINFVPSKHNGHLTLSSDDIINYWLKKHPEAFDFMMFVDEAAFSPKHAARIRTGASGKRRLKQLMAE